MSHPSSGPVRSQDNLPNPPRPNSPGSSHNSNNGNRYLAPPSLPQTASLLPAQEPLSSHSSPSQYAHATNAPFRSSSRRNRGSNSYSNSSATSPDLRPQRSLVMKHRLRRLNDYYEGQLQNTNSPEGSQPQLKPLPPLPPGVNSSQGGGLPKRRGASIGRGSRQRRDPGATSSYSQPNTEEQITSGLLNHESDGGGEHHQYPKLGRTGSEPSSYAGVSEPYEMQPIPLDLSTIDLNDDGAEKARRLHGERLKYGHDYKCEYESTEERHYRTLTEALHGHRPDRHLFPYRNRKDNLHALKTFLRRFYFVLLIIPAWVIPKVVTAQAVHEQQMQEAGGGQRGSEAGAAGGAEHGPMLSKWVNMTVFALNLLAMMHLGKAAGACMEELVPKLGMSVVSIFDAMTSSSVELAVAAFALMKGLVRVVQAAMLGAILNNLLLMMGLSLAVGGYYHNKQEIQADTSQTGMNLLMIVCISYVIPVALDYTFTDIRTAALPAHLNTTQLLVEHAEIREIVDHDLLAISKLMAVIMLLLYGCCLLFQYSSRSFMVTPEAKHTEAHTVHRRNVHYWFAGFGYTVMLGAQIYSANLLVHAVEALGKQFELNDSFVGFVLLPIVLISDLQEEVIAIKESRANRLDRSIALMIGSCMQIALLVTPLLVLLGWAIDEPMNFRFSVLEAVILAGSVLIVNYLIQDNETNWLEGCLLLGVFLMCALAFYFDIQPFEPAGGGHGSTSGGGASGGAGGGGGDHH